MRSAALACLIGIVLVSASTTWAANRNSATRVQLDRPLPAVNFSSVTFKDALEFLRDVSGANLHVNWKAIEAAGVTPDTTINLKLRDVPLRKVLGMVVSEASGGVGLTYYVEDGIIEITTREIADGIMYTVVYPVQDLLVEGPDLDSSMSAMGTLGSRSGGNNSNGYSGNNGYSGSSRSGSGRSSRSGGSRNSSYNGNGNNSYSGGPFSSTSANSNSNKPQTSKSDELISLITEVVYPDSWTQNGGKSTIRFFNGNLVVTAPRKVHEAIGGSFD